MASDQEVLDRWKIHAKNMKYDSFDEDKEKNWSDPFYFVQGADIQFGFIARELEEKEDIDWEKEIILAEGIIDKINKMRPKPKFFVICGDLCDAFPSNKPMRDEQELDFKRIFRKVDKDIPLVCVCGNHEVGNTPTYETVESYRSSFGDDYYSFWCGGLLFIVVNSQYFYDPSEVPDLANEQTRWIEDRLEEARKKRARVIMFQHIPWFLKTADEDDMFYFTIKSQTRKLWLDKLKESGVEAIFCGHFHRNSAGSYRGMEVVTTSAIGGQLGSDKSGARIVKIFENKIEHKYYAIEDLPLETEL